MVMMAPVLAAAIEARRDAPGLPRAWTILMTPDGRPFDHASAAALRWLGRAARARAPARRGSHAGVSARHLERVFFARVGLGPKAFARIVRFQNVLRSSLPDWAAIAADCGYTDQAHLIHEFREFTGQTPAEGRASQVAFLQDLETQPH